MLIVLCLIIIVLTPPGEGVSYRGRLLIALKTDISDSIDTAPSEVETMPTQTINEVGRRKEGRPLILGRY